MMYLIYGSIALFVVFYAVWIVVMRHIGQSKIIQWGGGFIAACLVLIGVASVVGQVSKENAPYPTQAVAALSQEQKTQADYGPTLGLSFTEVTKGFNEYGMGFNASPLSTGEPRMMAQADGDKAYASLEVMGVSDNINRTTLTIAPAEEDSLINLGNVACMAIFLNNTMPEWEERSNWLYSALKTMAEADATDKAQQETVYGGKRLKVSMVNLSGVRMIFLTVQHKDYKESGRI